MSKTSEIVRYLRDRYCLPKAAAFYNVSTTEDIPDVQVSTTAAAFIRTAVLVALYTVALFPVEYQYIMWFAVTFLCTWSLIASYLTTDSDFLKMEQRMFDLANKIERCPESVRRQVKKIVSRYMDDNEAVDLDAEFEKCLLQCDERDIAHIKNTIR